MFVCEFYGLFFCSTWFFDAVRVFYLFESRCLFLFGRGFILGCFSSFFWFGCVWLVFCFWCVLEHRVIECFGCFFQGFQVISERCCFFFFSLVFCALLGECFIFEAFYSTFSEGFQECAMVLAGDFQDLIPLGRLLKGRFVWGLVIFVLPLGLQIPSKKVFNPLKTPQSTFL